MILLEDLIKYNCFIYFKYSLQGDNSLPRTQIMWKAGKGGFSLMLELLKAIRIVCSPIKLYISGFFVVFTV